MKLLIELYGEEKAFKTISFLKEEIPGMHDDYYVRNAIRIINNTKVLQ